MKTSAMRWDSGLFHAALPQPAPPQRLRPHRPLVKTLSGSSTLARVRPDREGFTRVEPRAMLDGVRERCGARAAAKQVGITMHASARSACVHPHTFALVICELVYNAIDASARDQDVVVLVSDTGDGDLLWQVQDDGVGMSEHQLAGVGEPVAGEPHARGILRARLVVEAHGGLIHFESTPTLGTTASVWLPRATQISKRTSC